MKRLIDFRLEQKSEAGGCCIITLACCEGFTLPKILPGQFVEVKIDNCPSAMLRRPISVCDVTADGRLVLFVKPLGEGTRHLVDLPIGSKINILLPLGNGFGLVEKGKKVLVVGGGIGAAPLVMLTRQLLECGVDVTIAIGGRSASDLQGVLELYPDKATKVCSTDDGSRGHHGLITANPVFDKKYDKIYCCGPTPMMKGVAHIAFENDVECEVSLENHMACGLGACLCCVEKTNDGNVCVCTEGPVFNINRLSWQ